MGEGRPRRTLVYVNRKSRNGRLGIRAAAECFRAGGFELIEAPIDSPRELTRCIRESRGDVDCVIIGGGDGTIRAAANGLVETGLPLGVLPLGTANDFARSIGIPSEPEAAARVIVDGFTHNVDVGYVNDHAFFNVASVGLAADVAKSLTSDHKRRFGPLSYALSAINILAQTKPFHATLLVGDEKIMVRTLQIAVGNGRYYGGGNVIVTDARIDDGHLDLYSLEFSRVWRMALLIPSFKSGGHGGIREVRTARGDTFEIITRKPRSVNADGEIVTKTPAVFTQKSGAVKVYVPETCPLVRIPVSPS